MNGILRTRKRFGQHFLKDEGFTADRIVDLAGIVPGDTVLEIGPGKGILTGRLLDKAGHVTAVEIDRDLVELLAKKFGGRNGFRLVEADILSVDLEELFRDVTGRIKVVSNLPYNISTPVIELLIRNRRLVSGAVLMVQKEVAGRLVAKNGTKDYGLTTLNLAICAKCRIAMDIKPGSFEPPPEVMSSVITISFDENYLYPLRNERIFREITGAAFRHRRKMVRNTMIPFMVSRGLDKPEANKVLDDAGIDPMSRPEAIDVTAFVAVSNALDELTGCSAHEETMS